VVGVAASAVVWCGGDSGGSGGSSSRKLVIMVALHSRCRRYIFVLFLSFFFLFFPRLISAVADCMSTILLQMVLP